MSSTAIPPAGIAVDVAVTLIAIVRQEPDAGGYSASIPALPGCDTEGDTFDEVRANLREAAEGWLAVAHDDGGARSAAQDVPGRSSSASRCAASSNSAVGRWLALAVVTTFTGMPPSGVWRWFPSTPTGT